MARKAVSKGRARDCHDAKRNGAVPPQLSMDTHETELLPKKCFQKNVFILICGKHFTGRL